MAALAELVAEAFADGYATVDGAWPPPPSLDTHLGAALAAVNTVEAHHGVLLVTEAGRTVAARTVLHRARLRLYASHRKPIVTAALAALAGLPVAELARSLILLADHPRSVRRDQALSSLRSAAYGRTGEPADWVQANTDGWQAATERGYAEAAARPAPGKTPDPKTVTAGLSTAAVAIGGLIPGGGRQWVDGQLRRLAWGIAGQHLEASDDPAGDLGDYIADGGQIGDAAEDQMHASWSDGFTGYVTASGVDTLYWQTEEDNLVCQACQDNEDGSPYFLGADTIPDMPAHPNCRCNWA